MPGPLSGTSWLPQGAPGSCGRCPRERSHLAFCYRGELSRLVAVMFALLRRSGPVRPRSRHQAATICIRGSAQQSMPARPCASWHGCLRRAAVEAAGDLASGTASRPSAAAGSRRDRARGGQGPAAHPSRHRSGRADAGEVGMGVRSDFGARYALLWQTRSGNGHCGSRPSRHGLPTRRQRMPTRTGLVRLSQSLCALNSQPQASGSRLPVPLYARRFTPTRCGQRMPNCCARSRQPWCRSDGDPGSAGESVAELCDGITISASRLRGAMRDSKDRARWSPNVTSGGWQWMAQAAAVTSHLSELALGALATRAGQLPGPPVSEAQLRDAADFMVGMRAAWHQVDRMWDVMITESRMLPTQAMTDASDLVLRMGRLVWDDPHWTPAHSRRAPLRDPAALAPETRCGRYRRGSSTPVG